MHYLVDWNFMWIVRLALRRPHTFVVVSLMLALLGGLAIVRMPTDIFPDINLPIVNVIWTYTGISAEDMAKRIVTVSERGLTTVVDDIEHMESQSEVRVKNPEHKLLPGMYAQVKFSIARSNAPPRIPGDTLVIRSPGTQVALVEPDGKVHFQEIELGRDYGPEIEVLAELSEGQTIIVNPTDEIREGVVVQPRK